MTYQQKREEAQAISLAEAVKIQEKIYRRLQEEKQRAHEAEVQAHIDPEIADLKAENEALRAELLAVRILFRESVYKAWDAADRAFHDYMEGIWKSPLGEAVTTTFHETIYMARPAPEGYKYHDDCWIMAWGYNRWHQKDTIGEKLAEGWVVISKEDYKAWWEREDARNAEDEDDD